MEAAGGAVEAARGKRWQIDDFEFAVGVGGRGGDGFPSDGLRAEIVGAFHAVGAAGDAGENDARLRIAAAAGRGFERDARRCAGEDRHADGADGGTAEDVRDRVGERVSER